MTKANMTSDNASPARAPFDSSSDQRFTAYYEEASLSEATALRFGLVKRKIEWMLRRAGRAGESLDVVDIGCGAGTQSLMWAESGHRVTGVDINEPLVGIAKTRLEQKGLTARFDVGSATSLPYSDCSFDVVLIPELLEHVGDWKSCIDEALRVLRPHGIIYLSTTNYLCPKQQEFALPLYSWYPARLKRYCVEVSLTTHPEWVSHARYPAVHWFSPYQLGAYLDARGVRPLDRFDMLNLDGRPRWLQSVMKIVKAVPPLRWLGHVASPGTTLFGVRR
jgi:2-polyprenyl-3-methyl-5-hydroxy-6-metoxy-1,4-benzoquinol methylase